MKRRADPAGGWLLLIHQIPPKPSYFRAKVGRRLARIGAVAIKNSVYALPFNEGTQEDLQWVAREIVAEGGEATLCRASFVEGLRDEQVQALFHTARESEYSEIAEEARGLAREVSPKLARDDERRSALDGAVARLKKRLADVIGIDFFGAPGRETAESALAILEKRLATDEPRSSETPERPKKRAFQGRVWVTRKNIHVDRIASAWLIRRFIDARPTFKFVIAQGYRPKPAEVTFDMFEAMFTHVGDRCTFEVLLDQFDLRDPGLVPLAQMIHDIDIKDGKFGREETPGFANVIAGIALANRDDERRIEVGTAVLDALLELYRSKRS